MDQSRGTAAMKADAARRALRAAGVLLLMVQVGIAVVVLPGEALARLRAAAAVGFAAGEDERIRALLGERAFGALGALRASARPHDVVLFLFRREHADAMLPLAHLLYPVRVLDERNFASLDLDSPPARQRRYFVLDLDPHAAPPEWLRGLRAVADGDGWRIFEHVP
jgi:hypothetical protein